MRIVLIILLLTFGLSCKSQNIYQVKNEVEANLKVFVTDFRTQADLLVYRVGTVSEAKDDGLWYFVTQSTEAKIKVYFTPFQSTADLVIFFVDIKSEAGWKNLIKKQLFMKF